MYRKSGKLLYSIHICILKFFRKVCKFVCFQIVMYSTTKYTYYIYTCMYNVHRKGNKFIVLKSYAPISYNNNNEKSKIYLYTIFYTYIRM